MMHRRFKRQTLLAGLISLLGCMHTQNIRAQNSPSVQFDPHIMAQARESVISVQCRCGKGENGHLQIGSGFIVHEDGFAVTQRSVVYPGEEIQVTLHHGEKRRGKLVYDNIQTGVAIIKIDGQVFRSAYSDNQHLPELGGCLALLGNSLGVFPSVAMTIYDGLSPQGVMQLHAVIPPGNSGAPLFNPQGHVVGMVIGRLQGAKHQQNKNLYGLAMPIAQINQEVDAILQFFSEFPGWVGLSVNDLHEPSAVVVEQVVQGGPAHRAGIASGDTIVALEGRPFSNASDLERKVTSRQPQSVIHFTMKHGAVRIEQPVTVQKRQWFEEI